MSNPPKKSEPPQHSKEAWRLRRVQRAQPHLDEGERSWVSLWAAFTAVIVVLIAVGTFLVVWLGAFNHTDRVESLPLAASPSRTAATVGTEQFTSTPAPALVPVLTPTATILPLTPSRPVPTVRPTAGVVRYRVKPGDTLTAIAAMYHVTVQAIMTANRLQSDTIYDGQELIIPLPTPVP